MPISGTGRDIDRWVTARRISTPPCEERVRHPVLMKLELVEVIIIWLTRVSD